MNGGDTFTVRELRAHDLPILKAALPDWTPSEWENADTPVHRLRVLLHEVDGTEMPAGIAEYQQILDEGHLLGIAIIPALRGGGLGMQLLRAVLEEMRGSGCTRCLLEVRRSNVAAQSLYERSGFLLDGQRKDYYPAQGSLQREDALLYSLAL